ncbi:energy transducer TonB [soil metagenome]
MNLLLKSWDNPTSQERLEVVFEGRNHNYGAYTIRREYEKNIVKALLITCSTGLLLAFSPIIYKYLNPQDVLPLEATERIFTIDPILPDKTLPKEDIPIPATPPPPKEPVQGFSIPTVTDLDINDSVPTQENLSHTNIGVITDTTSGIDTSSISPDLPDVGGTKEAVRTILDVQELPAFPGGEVAMIQFLAHNIHYPGNARQRNIHGVVYISFIINATGDLEKVTLLRGIGGGCEEEALRVVNKMPQWRPGKQNGRPVPVQYNLPISFTLRDN